MNVKITRDWTKSFFVMIVAVIIMGMCVSLLVMCVIWEQIHLI